MTIRAPTRPPDRGWRDAPLTEDQVAACLELWDKGFNTADIARTLMIPEYTVDRTVRWAREARRDGQDGPG